MAAKISPSVVGITGPHKIGVGFFIDIEKGSPDSDYILTKHSLVEGECRVAVQLSAGRFEGEVSKVWGQIYAADEILDLAIVKIPSIGSTVVEWGNWEDVTAGDRVFAFGFRGTNRTTNKSVEGSVKEIHTPNLSLIENSPKASFVLTDIERMPDYDGGPLVNLEGQVLAINFTDVDPPDERANRGLSLSLSAEALIGGLTSLYRGGPVLETTPSSPVAGRPVSFTLKIQPYQPVEITLLNPEGQEVDWIYPEGITKAVDGETVATRTFGADPCGKVEWERRGFLDNQGDWTVRVTLDPFTTEPYSTDLTYTMSEPDLEEHETVHMWTELRRYQGPTSDAFYSELVPAALAVDLQSQLVRTASLLDERLGVKAGETQDLYLMGNRNLFEQVERYMGLEAGFEIAFYAIPCLQCLQDRPGIYIQMDAHESETTLLLTLAHEYAHSLVAKISNGKSDVLPTWVNEGLATWSFALPPCRAN